MSGKIARSGALAALTLGTERHGGDPRALLEQVAVETLLRRAGVLPKSSATTPPTIARDSRPLVSPSVASAVAQAARGACGLLVELACERIHRRGERLPPHVQALVLATTNVATARDPRCSVGGATLAQAWHHAGGAGFVDEPAGERAALEERWRDGTPAERCQAFRRLRALDSAGARELLKQGWPDEEAALRGELIDALTLTVEPADEEWLVLALADRSQVVRSRVARALATLGSAELAERAWQRAASCVKLVSERTGLLRRLTKRLVVEPPAAWDPDWVNDGLVEKAPSGRGQRAWWLEQIVALAPAARWCSTFETTPAELLALAAETDFSRELVTGWATAALGSFARVDGVFVVGTGGDPAWARPLALHLGKLEKPLPVPTLHAVLREREEAREELVLELLGSGAGELAQRLPLLDALALPWSAPLSKCTVALLANAMNSGKFVHLDARAVERFTAAVHPDSFAALLESLQSTASPARSDFLENVRSIRLVLDQELPA